MAEYGIGKSLAPDFGDEYAAKWLVQRVFFMLFNDQHIMIN